jgi:hypothetical protein
LIPGHFEVGYKLELLIFGLNVGVPDLLDIIAGIGPSLATG